MKIFVDKLPNNCRECLFAQLIEYSNCYPSGIVCILNKQNNELNTRTEIPRPEDCPLEEFIDFKSIRFSI